MKIGFSTSHACQATEEFLSWTSERIKHLDYFRFEICHERNAGPRALGAIDDYIRYKALDKLNDHKMHATGHIDGLRRVYGRMKEEGREIAQWSHELAAPREILSLYPELATKRGDLNLQHPLLTEWLREKYGLFFKTIPEVDVIVLTMTEVDWPVMHRFDCEWSQKECIAWLIGTLHGVCEEHGKTLVVRPFSAIVSDYIAAREALMELPANIEVMLKSDPFDWDPHLPLNPELRRFAPERLTMEMDLGGEYFGRGYFPVIFPEYIRERLDHARALGIPRVIARLDRRGVSSLATEARLNVEYFAGYAADPDVNAEAYVTARAADEYKPADAGALVRALCDGFEVVKKMFYVDGHLLFHNVYGDLKMAQRCVLFETLRPGQPLAHCRNEWHILDEKQSPSVEAARREKAEALALAEDLLGRLREAAPGHDELLFRGESLVLFAKLYAATAVALQEYILQVDPDTGEDSDFDKALDALRSAASALVNARGADWLDGMAGIAARFPDELRLAFDQERDVRRRCGWIKPEEHGRVVDFVPAGYPGEGHRLSKFTHGSMAVSDESSRWRIVGRHLAYTVAAAPGTNELCLRLRGAGAVRISADGAELAQDEWDGFSDWQEKSIVFDTTVREVQVRFDKSSGQSCEVGGIALLKS